MSTDDSLSSVPASPVSPPPPAPPPVESLVAGRARRANAGNLLAKLLTQEADEEDTLFLEDEDDVEFTAKGAAEEEDEDEDDDALMEDSDDDVEDAGPPPAEGEEGEGALEGEKEIVDAEKEAKKKRRKVEDSRFLKPKVPKPREREVTAAGTAERQRKKSERISWVPEFVATRASSRTLSLQNRSETMRRLEESEKRRLHTIALMERAAAKKAKVRPKREMTQEERLEEAKITERRNRRSLFSWEETEKAKLEEQRKKLLALQNRKLAGPVVTYWSGRAEWNQDTGKLVKVGTRGLVEEVVVKQPVKKEKGKKKKEDAEMEGDTIQVGGPLQPPPVTAEATAPPPTTITAAAAAPSQESTTAPPPPAAASQESTTAPPPPAPATEETREDLPAPSPQPEEPPLPPPPKPTELSARTCVVLENFDANAVRDKASLSKSLFGHTPTKPTPVAKPYCHITQQPAKFRDPATGMPFANLHAYREMRRLLSGEIRWSHLLGAYVGQAGDAACGVPEGF